MSAALHHVCAFRCSVCDWVADDSGDDVYGRIDRHLAQLGHAAPRPAATCISECLDYDDARSDVELVESVLPRPTMRPLTVADIVERLAWAHVTEESVEAALSLLGWNERALVTRHGYVQYPRWITADQARMVADARLLYSDEGWQRLCDNARASLSPHYWKAAYGVSYWALAEDGIAEHDGGTGFRLRSID